MTELSQAVLEEMVEGKKPNPRAIFYEQAVLNIPESKAQKRRVYEKKVYIKLSQVGVQDSISYEAQQGDIRNYPEEYEYFLENKQGVRAPSIDIIPNLDIVHLQEMRDYGILTIPQLAGLEHVPEHLEYAHRAAKVLNQALQETDHVEEKPVEENPVEEAQQASSLPAPDRREHRPDVGRRVLPESHEDRSEGGSSERNGTGGRPQRNISLTPNWEIQVG